MIFRQAPMLAAAGVLLASATALAFSRDISGVWKTPRGTTVVVVHDQSRGRASFVFATSLPSISANRLEFRTQLAGMKDVDDNSSANDFMFGGPLEAISFQGKGTVCTLEGDLNGMGTVLGQAPGRKLSMTCKMTLRVRCEDGTNKALKQQDCSGNWE